MEPLGLADLAVAARFDHVRAELPEHWAWCRRHEQAHKVGERCHRDHRGGRDTFSPKSCIDIGPFMSEREALRLTTPGAPYGKTVKHLGMEVEL